MNPFTYGTIVKGDNYISRNEDILLSKDIDNARNVALIGLRRIGKSSMIHHVVPMLKRQLIYVDLYNVDSVNDIVRRTVTAFNKIDDLKVIKRIGKALLNLRPVISLDPLTSQASIGIDEKKQYNTETLDDIFSAINSIQSKVVVAFDEFQSLYFLKDSKKILAEFRNHIQQKPQNISYIFSGSIRSYMSMIFRNADEPFFKSVNILEVNPIEVEKIIPWVSERFNTKKIEKSHIEKIHKDLEGISGDIQEYLAALWDISEEEINEDTLSKAYDNIIRQKSYLYSEKFFNFTTKQRKVLKAFAHQENATHSSAEFLEIAGANSAYMARALNKFEIEMVLYKNHKRWTFSDPFFKQWIRQQ